MARDGTDTRQVNVTLTQAGQGYAEAVTKVIERLNRDLIRRVDPADLAGADAVLRAVLVDERSSASPSSSVALRAEATRQRRVWVPGTGVPGRVGCSSSARISTPSTTRGPGREK